MNIRHQRHCAELESIRERVREKREKRQEKFLERTAGKKNTKTENSDRSQSVRKKRRIGEDKENSDSEDEKCNGGLRMFQGTLIMMKQRERRLVEKHNASVPPTPVSSVDLVSYEDQQSDDDEAPTEVRTVVSYENNLVEEGEKTSEVSKESPLVKKSRKKKKKTLAVSDQTSSNPPIPGEEDQEPDVEMENNVEEVPEIAEDKAVEIQEEAPVAAADDAEKLPAVFRKRLRQPTLLEKLLLSEIKKERNTILQCVRYVCKNNFFQQ